jgi:uncharacterized protein (TIGR02466 family)|tara:strand:- start:5867 stop:6478 length:612 start_codon:yes stop_codon:yes gene_type:complete
MRLENIFPIPFVQDNIDVEIIDNTITKVNAFLLERDFCNPPAPRELLTTFYDDKNFLGNIGAVDLLKLINFKTREFFKVIGWDSDCFVEITSWLQYNQPGSYFVRHDHYGAILSGVVYLQTPVNGGDILFHTPLEQRRVTNAFFERIKKEENDYNNSHIKISPAKGDILMFEPWLQHTVQENKSTEARISVGFNIWADSDGKR